jgi:putative transposase
MLRTAQFACSLPNADADALNAESGRLYPDMVACHYRIYRRKGVWLRPEQGERWQDAHGGATILHAHYRDAAQQGCSTFCTTARACKAAGKAVGLDVQYPYHHQRWRTTRWKASGIRLRDGALQVAHAHGLALALALVTVPVTVPVTVALPPHLLSLPSTAFREARLVGDGVSEHSTWHLVSEDGVPPTPPPPGEHTAALDLGEIHPAAATEGNETVVLACRALRSNQQYTAKRVGERTAKQDRKHKGSRRWQRLQRLQRLQRRTTRLRAQQRRRARDLEHKVSRAVVDWASERQVHTLVIGDVRAVADGKRLRRKSQQKIGVWSHGRQRQYLTYKAVAAGVTVILVDEAYTTPTCPGTLLDGTGCLHCYKPTGARLSLPGLWFYGPSRRRRGGQPALAALHGGARPCAASARDVALPLLETQTRQAWPAGHAGTGPGSDRRLRTRPRSRAYAWVAECHERIDVREKTRKVVALFCI